MMATDENHVVSAEAIAEYLKTEYEMSAERRSVGVDIKAINAAMLMLDQGCTIEQGSCDTKQNRRPNLNSPSFSHTTSIPSSMETVCGNRNLFEGTGYWHSYA